MAQVGREALARAKEKVELSKKEMNHYQFLYQKAHLDYEKMKVLEAEEIKQKQKELAKAEEKILDEIAISRFSKEKKMIKKFILLVFISSVVFGAEQDCEQYFEARKTQIELQTREFDEARQSLEAYKASFEALQKERLEKFRKKEAEVNATLAKIEELKLENARLVEEQQRF